MGFSLHFHGNVSGSDAECCIHGTCPCSSLKSALQHLTSNTTIDITSKSVTLNIVTQIVSGFLHSITFQTHFVQLTKPSQVFVRPTGIQALPSPVNSTIITIFGNGATITCNNSGGVCCELCNDVVIVGITVW